MWSVISPASYPNMRSCRIVVNPRKGSGSRRGRTPGCARKKVGCRTGITGRKGRVTWAKPRGRAADQLVLHQQALAGPAEAEAVQGAGGGAPWANSGATRLPVVIDISRVLSVPLSLSSFLKWSTRPVNGSTCFEFDNVNFKALLLCEMSFLRQRAEWQWSKRKNTQLNRTHFLVWCRLLLGGRNWCREESFIRLRDSWLEV